MKSNFVTLLSWMFLVILSAAMVTDQIHHWGLAWFFWVFFLIASILSAAAGRTTVSVTKEG